MGSDNEAEYVQLKEKKKVVAMQKAMQANPQAFL